MLAREVTPMNAGTLVSIGLALAAPIFAQSTYVLPRTFATKEGTGFTNLPFGRSVPLRVQMAYGATLFSGSRTIQGVGFRPEPNSARSAKVIDLEVHVGTLAGDVVAIRPTRAVVMDVSIPSGSPASHGRTIDGTAAEKV